MTARRMFPTTAMSVDWKGETQPAVATGDGVKEPLNRRSTIDINFQVARLRAVGLGFVRQRLASAGQRRADGHDRAAGGSR